MNAVGERVMSTRYATRAWAAADVDPCAPLPRPAHAKIAAVSGAWCRRDLERPAHSSAPAAARIQSTSACSRDPDPPREVAASPRPGTSAGLAQQLRRARIHAQLHQEREVLGGQEPLHLG